jgi:hypothetical protein
MLCAHGHVRTLVHSLGKFVRYGELSSLVALIWFALLTVAIQHLFGIYYETNDDVGMMMVAQGFGLTDQPSALLLYSNRLQGQIVSWLGWPFGLPGYSLYLFACLLVSLAAIVAAMTRFNEAFPLNLLVVSALALRPLFAPQFTIVAALLMAAGVLALERYRRDNESAQLLAASAFALLAFLMRPEAMMMVALLSLPLVLRVSLLTSPAALAAGGLTGAAILGACLWDQAGYSTTDWAAYNAMDLPRAWFTDFANASLVLKRPDLLASVGWSANDARMLVSGWWLDPDVYSPEKLQRVIDGVGLAALFTHEPRLWHWAKTFTMPDMLPGTILTLAILPLLPRGWRWRMAGLVAIFFAVTLLFTFAGRLDVSRIFYPCLAIASVFAFGVHLSRRATRLLIGAVAALAVILSTGHHVPAAAARRAAHDSTMQALQAAHLDEVLFEWAGTLPYEALYPTFLRRDRIPAFDIHSLGSDQWAPYALTRWGGDVRNALARFKAPASVRLIATDHQVSLLSTYCQERWHGQLMLHSTIQIGSGSLYHAACRSISKEKD